MEEKETAEEKFTRIAKRRVNDTLDCYRLLANLAGSAYKSTSQQRDKIIHALRAGLDELEYTFAGSKTDKSKFSFDDEEAA